MALSQLIFTYHGDPVAKPRMTQRDKWAQRSCVTAYWHFADAFRASAYQAGYRAGQIILTVDAVVYLPIPSSWSKARKSKAAGQTHDRKPDSDNFLKAVCDALTSDDSAIWHKQIEKYFDDGNGPRLEVTLGLAPENWKKL